MRRQVAAFLQCERGQDLIEYALLAATLSLGVVFAMRSVGTGVGALWSSIGDAVTAWAARVS